MGKLQTSHRLSLWTALLIFGLLLGPAQAGPPPEVLILPVTMPGYQNPVDSEKLAGALEEELHKRAPGAHLQLGRGADLTAYAYTAGSDSPPSFDSAQRMARAYEARYVTWVSLRFQPDYHADTGALALAAAARVWVYDVNTQSVRLDQPLSLVRMGQVAQLHDEAAAQETGRELARGIISDLAGQLVAIAQRSTTPTETPAWTPAQDELAEVEKSRNYKAMARAADTYLRATKNNNIVDITESQAAMTSTWPQLNSEERKAMEENYPGITSMMEQPGPYYYYYGPGYWPYRYSYGTNYAPVRRR